MYDYIKGTIVRQDAESVTIECMGIGYRVLIPASFRTAFQKETTLFVSYVIREFAHALYGFQNQEERTLFEKLLNVTGIGPKLALSIIGHIDAGRLRAALLSKDTAILCKVPGIGKKTAERLIVELKDSLPDLLGYAADSIDSPAIHAQDAISALVNLGYSQQAAAKAVRKQLDKEPEVQDLAALISGALKEAVS